MAAQKFTDFDNFFLMHADMTAITIQSNKMPLRSDQQQLSQRILLQPPTWPPAVCDSVI